MNGYSGYTPASYQRYADAFWYFPQDWTIQAMKTPASPTSWSTSPRSCGTTSAGPVDDNEPASTNFELVAVGADGVEPLSIEEE